nr:hypothetical protein HmN_000178900 [Hymenolepis microstoma]
MSAQRGLKVSITRSSILTYFKPALGVRLSTDVVTRESTESPEHLNDFDIVVLRQMTRFLDIPTTENIPESIGGSEDTERVSSNDESSGSSQTVQFQAQSTANCTVQLQQASPQQEQQALTPRQMALWNEYCGLIQWKDYFYQH